MPAAIAAIIRVIIQTAVQTGIWFGIDTLLLKPLKEAVQENMVEKGMSEEEAKDHVANDLIDLFGVFGVTGIAIKSRMPNKVADYLGFTSKGYSKRIIKPKTPVISGPVTLPVPKPGQSVLTAAVKTSVDAVENSKITKPGFKVAYDLTVKTLGVAFLGAMTVGNWIDFANWNQGAYQGFFQNLYAKITGGMLVPDADYRQSLTLGSDVFEKVYNTYKLEGATGINDPWKGQQVPFTRENFLDLTDKVGAKLLSTNGRASTKDVLLATQMMMLFNNEVVKASTGVASQSSGVVLQPIASSTGLPKVFTGVVSQGVVGRGLAFEPRPDDLIESLAELKQAAANNLTPYLQSLLSKIVYEIKIVSSYVAKDGTTQRGITQQVRNGSYQDGRPKYKTVTNKFATLNVYAVSDKGVRTKLTTIVLGPTNSAKLTVNINDIAELESQLPAMVTTSDINEIAGIETTNSVTVTTPTTSVAAITAPPRNSEGIPTNATKINAENDAPEGWNVQRVASGLYTWPTDAPQSLAEQQARTLSEWYAARGQKLPSVSDRAIQYQTLGLGPASYYVGSAEQNTRLLAALKNPPKPEPMKDSSKSESASGSSSKMTQGTTKGNVPTLKGKKVNIPQSKITEYASGGAKIDGTMFTKEQYTEFKKLRKQFSAT